jgi:hypothetical protein
MEDFKMKHINYWLDELENDMFLADWDMVIFDLAMLDQTFQIEFNREQIL